MSWLICGTVPDDAFPLCMGTWRTEGNMLVPADVQVCGGKGTVPAVPVERGTPALAAAAALARRVDREQRLLQDLFGILSNTHGSIPPIRKRPGGRRKQGGRPGGEYGLARSVKIRPRTAKRCTQ